MCRSFALGGSSGGWGQPLLTSPGRAPPVTGASAAPNHRHQRIHRRESIHRRATSHPHRGGGAQPRVRAPDLDDASHRRQVRQARPASDRAPRLRRDQHHHQCQQRQPHRRRHQPLRRRYRR